MFRIKIKPYTLQFKQPAGTSRGVYTEHKVWYVIFLDTEDESHYGIGECAPLHDLSCDYSPDYAGTLAVFCRLTEERQAIDKSLLRPYPSILFGLETAWQHYQQHSWQLWNTPFSKGDEGITINGLIWMADYTHMLKQIEKKLDQGFHCIKLKIGSINFDQELSLLRSIRSRFPANRISLRVDANGNFANEDVFSKLRQLAELDIHSIEQPIRAGQWKEMAELCAGTPLPVALDEELIGINEPAEKQRLLKTIRPQYIILKPTLHGGIAGSTEWIELAEDLKIGWWITSALESNIGLNCISQWCSTFRNPLPQGLGTGMLYTNNINMPLEIKDDKLWFDNNGSFPDSGVYKPAGLMNPDYSYSQTGNIRIEGKVYYKTDFTNGQEPAFAGKSPFFRQLYLFLKDWFSESSAIEVQTSGSTGTPRKMTVRKAQMLQSAKMTCDFFGLKDGNKILLCLPLDYIAGKMVVVRALYAGLDLYPQNPGGHPLAENYITYDFAAMVPLQVYNTLQVKEEAQRLSGINVLIIGGGSIDEALENKLKEFPNAIYSTYGMTETLSHIALRRISGNMASSYYTLLSPSVKLALSEQDTLIIDAPLVSDEKLVTNDIAELRMDGTFRIKGRKDNVIISGGIKIQIEEVEQLLQPHLKGNFAVTSIPHPRLGEAVVLLTNRPDLSLVREIAEAVLPRYQQPLYICTVQGIPQTGNGKTDRRATKELAGQTVPPAPI